MKMLCMAALVLAASGCAEPPSNLKHNLKQPVNSTDSGQWRVLNEDELRRFAQAMFGADASPSLILADDQPEVQKLQGWLDRMDAALRARYPDQLRWAPKPQAKVLNQPEVNAMVSAVPACLDFALRFEGSSGPAANSVLLDRRVRDMKVFGDFCIETDLTHDQQKSLLSWWLQPYRGCTIRFEEQTVIAEKGCDFYLAAGPGSIGSASKLMVAQTSSIVWVNSGLLQQLDEHEVVSVLAHELSHYYMSHGNADPGLYYFFYQLGPHNSQQKPAPDPSLAAFGEKLWKASQQKADLMNLHAVEGQAWHSILFEFTKYTSKLFYEAECRKEIFDGRPCEKPCYHLKQFFDDPLISSQLAGFPAVPLKADNLMHYRRYEELLTSCTSELFLTEKAFAEGGVARWLLELMPSYVGDGALAALGIPLAQFQKVRDVYDFIQTEYPKTRASQEAEAHQVLQEAIDRQLVYYTTEQEADEQSLEMLHEMGIDPKTAITTQLKIARLSDPLDLAYGEVSGEDCERLYQNHWQDPSGGRVMIPVADWQDDHHSHCFRAFNMDREIQAHDLKR
ncbi:M48 family metalloprotease [Oligoflexus tunisiensis]|uniref:M48 family metalloprotease n=1 Tax=Oligoflexus tunisiensis TaxID=708132 RepID=UPI00159F11F3|nr:M48 family metalloprotease [Oligoflexus tunisiensis]